jgi:hypothetical protein
MRQTSDPWETNNTLKTAQGRLFERAFVKKKFTTIGIVKQRREKSSVHLNKAMGCLPYAYMQEKLDQCESARTNTL